MQRVLFYRDFRRFTGRHLNVRDYSNHVRSSPAHTAHVAFTRESGLDAGPAPSSAAGRDFDLLVVARQQRERGAVLLPRLERAGRPVHLLGDPVPRRELLAWMNRARVTLFLPRRTEGFYLPALEGMALRTLVVCPDCVGNRSFCLPGVNSLRPAYTDADVLDQVEAAMALPPDEMERL